MGISCTILAGGRAMRMGGVDKGLVKLHKKPLIQFTIDRMRPQVDEIFINANRELAKYSAFQCPILQDEYPDFIGPLAGFSLALQHATQEYVLTVPCDSPFLPQDLAAKLFSALIDNHADIAVASSDGNVHPVISLSKKSVLSSLLDFISRGERKVSLWQKSLAYVEVDFRREDIFGKVDPFLNINTLEQLNALEQVL